MNLLWKPLLAATLDAEKDFDRLPYPLLGSYKIDGFRAMIQRGVLVGRKGLEPRNRAAQIKFGKLFEGLDGELTMGKPNAANVFHRTSTVLTSGAAERERLAMEGLQYHVFDYYDPQLTFLQRQERLKMHMGLKRLRQVRINSTASLLAFEKQALALGYEGIMLRRYDSGGYPQKPGKSNRSTLAEFELVKLKRFEFGEAIIRAVHPLEHNRNEERTAAGRRSSKKSGIVVDGRRMGSVTLENRETGLEFSVTLGSDALRDYPRWAREIGKRVRFKYQRHGTKDKPRIPTCEFLEVLG